MHKIIAQLGLAATIPVIVAAACVPPTEPPPTTPSDTSSITVLDTTSTSTTTSTVPPTTLPPTSGNRYVKGDSITAQTASTGMHEGDGRLWSGVPGATISTHETGILAAFAEPAQTVILELSSNDAATWTYGWTAEDEATWTRILDQAAPNTCVVLVLPWALQTYEDRYPGSLENIDLARAYLSRQSARPNVIVTDWKEYVDQNPSIIGGDGLHIAAFGTDPNNVAAYARLTMIKYAEERCP